VDNHVDILDGAGNWSPWKTRIIFVLEDVELWNIVQAPMVIPLAPSPSPLLDVDLEEEHQGKKHYF
jgi:hypothetical protein